MSSVQDTRPADAGAREASDASVAAPTSDRGSPASAGRSSGATRSWGLPLAVVIIGMFMSILDTTIVNIALTDIRRDFGASIEDAQWVSTAYALTEGAIVPVSAWLGLRLGNKKLYICSLALFTLFSALCGISTSIPEMIVFRILQAIPGGMIPVMCITLIYRLVPPEKIGTAMGVYGLGITLAPGVGPTLGGYFVEYLSWPFIYWVNVPIGVAATLAAIVVLPKETGRSGVPFDATGFACIAGGLFAVLLALEKGSSWGWDGYRVLGLLFLGSNLILVWVIIELRSRHPLLDVRLFANRTFVLAMVVLGIMFVGMFAMVFNLPQFLQNVQERTPWHAGLIMLPYAPTLMVLMPFAGRVYDRIGPRWPAAIGMTLVAIGLFTLSWMDPDSTITDLVISQVVVAAGLGIAMMPVMTCGMSALGAALEDSGSAFTTLTQRVSQAFGTALLTAMINKDTAQFFTERSALLDARGANDSSHVHEMSEQGPRGLLALWQQTTNEAQTQAYGQAMLVTAGVVLAAALVALMLPTGKPAAPADGATPRSHRNGRTDRPRYARTTALCAAVVVLATLEAAGLGIRYLLVDHRYVVTDNAQVDGKQVEINAPTSGVVRDWKVDVGSAVRSREIVGRVEVQGSGGRPQRPVRSPGAGVVAHTSVTDGTYVEAGSLLATAYNDGDVYAIARVSEDEIADVRPGALVDITLDAASGDPVTGMVSVVGGASAGASELSGRPDADPVDRRMPIYPGNDTDPQNPQRVDQYIPVKILFTATGTAPIVPGTGITVHIHRP